MNAIIMLSALALQSAVADEADHPPPPVAADTPAETIDIPAWVQASCAGTDSESVCADVEKSVSYGSEPIDDVGAVLGGGPLASGGVLGDIRWARPVGPKPPACFDLGIGGVKRVALQLIGQVLTASNISYRASDASTLLSIYGQPQSDSKIFYIVRLDFGSFRTARSATRIACAIDVQSFRTWRRPNDARVIERDAISNDIYRQLMTRLDDTD